MNIGNDKRIFNKVLELIKVPEDDASIKESIMKAIYFLMVINEIAIFIFSIPGILLGKETDNYGGVKDE